MKITKSMAFGCFALAALAVLSACQSVERASTTASGEYGQAALRTLDEGHAEEFRRAFDEAKDRPRYVVALSPT